MVSPGSSVTTAGTARISSASTPAETTASSGVFDRTPSNSAVTEVRPGRTPISLPRLAASGASCGGSGVRNAAFFVTNRVSPSRYRASTRKSPNSPPTGKWTVCPWSLRIATSTGASGRGGCTATFSGGLAGIGGTADLRRLRTPRGAQGNIGRQLCPFGRGGSFRPARLSRTTPVAWSKAATAGSRTVPAVLPVTSLLPKRPAFVIFNLNWLPTGPAKTVGRGR